MYIGTCVFRRIPTDKYTVLSKSVSKYICIHTTYVYTYKHTHTEINPTFCLTTLQIFTHTHKILEKKMSLVFWGGEDNMPVFLTVSCISHSKI